MTEARELPYGCPGIGWSSWRVGMLRDRRTVHAIIRPEPAGFDRRLRFRLHACREPGRDAIALALEQEAEALATSLPDRVQEAVTAVFTADGEYRVHSRASLGVGFRTRIMVAQAMPEAFGSPREGRPLKRLMWSRRRDPVGMAHPAELMRWRDRLADLACGSRWPACPGVVRTTIVKSGLLVDKDVIHGPRCGGDLPYCGGHEPFSELLSVVELAVERIEHSNHARTADVLVTAVGDGAVRTSIRSQEGERSAAHAMAAWGSGEIVREILLGRRALRLPPARGLPIVALHGHTVNEFAGRLAARATLPAAN